jgi:hypothetical protein
MVKNQSGDVRTAMNTPENGRSPRRLKTAAIVNREGRAD